MHASSSKASSSLRIPDPRLLIDGYNLLFESTLVGSGRGPGWLQRARQRLLVLLESKLQPDECHTTTVVYDAPQQGEVQQRHVTDKGLTILFAIGYPEADDLLEEIIRRHSHPKQLRVISSDQRIRQRARARRAASIDTASFLKDLERRPSLSSEVPQSEAAAPTEPTLSAAEIDYWLQVFEGRERPPQ